MRIVALGKVNGRGIEFDSAAACLGLFLDFGDNEREALVDVTAVGAEPMGLAGLAALGATGYLDAREGVMRPAHAFFGFGGFTKWKHEVTSN